MTILETRAVLFDLDGVLADSTATIHRILRDWAAGHALDAEAAIRLSHGRRAVDVISTLAPHLDPIAEDARIVAVEERDFDGVATVPGAAELIAGLSPDAWAVVTSGARNVARGRLRAAGIPEPRHLVTANDVTTGKPDPEGYLLAARLLDVPPADCVVIEDAIAGRRAAAAAGMRCIGLGAEFAGATDEDAPDLWITELRQVTAAAGGLRVHPNA
ncbi:sugar-phosphatase [Herbihabitans rhizosphaerae]|uniref:Sugar-phosphatase n=1 Tax=Herbihabitans rhizosphaerae TaxID=1872711 RepID=A0A4Q7KUV8_9PSEU|nr:HAD-IA family hydrolase [Herbihabitans rhizosphaerae]RZS40789.1 sugar-phosphatase [Herbihabitans rhizosphaerae]